MKFGLVDGHRIEARPGLAGVCPTCGGLLVAKCGEVNIWHWAHVSQRNCDPWHEPEGPWHRAWKSHFPDEWQEVVHTADTGERHIADVRTARGWTIEFQHSHLAPNERRARDAFYPQLIWVVDATRRKADVPKLEAAWNEGTQITQSIRRLRAPDSALLRDWSGCHAPVLIDMGVDTLLWLIPRRTPGMAYIQLVQRATFISILCDDTAQARELEKQWTELPRQLALLDDEIARQEQARSIQTMRAFYSHSASRSRNRRRF